MESDSQSLSSREDCQKSLCLKANYGSERLSAGGVNGRYNIWIGGYNSASLPLSKKDALRLAQHIRDYCEQ